MSECLSELGAKDGKLFFGDTAGGIASAVHPYKGALFGEAYGGQPVVPFGCVVGDVQDHGSVAAMGEGGDEEGFGNGDVVRDDGANLCKGMAFSAETVTFRIIVFFYYECQMGSTGEGPV